ncbi:MAG: bifunctional hydroxymethylpyrimidine kinase/phosphomethylpyrimidine kinase, partial [Acidobacteriota bacterium]
YGTTAITAVTAQNTLGVVDVMALPPAFVVAQIEAVASDFALAATKIGMLSTGEIAVAVAQAIARLALPRVVLDTVMLASDGTVLGDENATNVMRSLLLPLANVVTANLQEAERLTGIAITSVDDMRRAATALVAMGARAAIVKGGHLDGDPVDVVYDGHVHTELRGLRIATPHTHGTGCTFAAAVAARLALGEDTLAAARGAKTYVARAIAQAPGLGHGHGPLQHFPR